MARKDSKDTVGDGATVRASHWLSHSEKGESTAAHDRSLSEESVL